MTEQTRLTLVTGGNSGIGFELARQLLADRSNHVLLGARSIAKGEAAVEELQSLRYPGKVEFVQVDVADEQSVAAAATLVDNKWGRLDSLVNNAGIAGSKGTNAEQMMACFRVNSIGPALMTEYFAPLLKKSVGVPRIVNITSGAGSISNRLDPNGKGNEMKVLPYRASKTALHMVFACQCREFEADGFKIFLYGPGHTVSSLGPFNKAEYGAKPTSHGTAPIVDMLNGKRDHDAGKLIEYGLKNFSW